MNKSEHSQHQGGGESEEISSLVSARLRGESYDATQAGMVFDALMAGRLSQMQMAALLTAMAVSTESEAELEGAAQAVLRKSVSLNAAADAIDIVGTGGDRTGTFNISSAAALLVRAAGVAVAKHGNRSVSSASGAADLYRAAGIPLDLTPPQVQTLLDDHNFAFLFAPTFHPAMRYVAPVRAELKIRTIFNLIGPLVNPARVKRYLVGVFDEAWMLPYARIMRNLGVTDAWIARGRDGMDEISPCGVSDIVVLADGEISKREISPADAGLPTHSLNDIIGGDADTNYRMLQDLLAGQHGAVRDAVLLNAAAALVMCGAQADLPTGVSVLARVIDSGEAAAFLRDYVRAAARHGA